jgi:hypothetical protein
MHVIPSFAAVLRAAAPVCRLRMFYAAILAAVPRVAPTSGASLATQLQQRGGVVSDLACGHNIL